MTFLSAPVKLLPLQGYEDHLRDASHFRGTAEAIAFPTSEAEVAQLLRQAARERKPVTVSGAGTGLTGARVPQGGIILCLERMNRILGIQWDEARQAGTVTVQPGVALNELDAALETQGLFYPPDPGEKAAFIGGTLSTNASGARSFKYGATRRHVQRLRLVLATGEVVEVRRGERPKSLSVPLPTYPAPKTTKNAAGYFTGPGAEPLDLFIGAEGTLGVITEAELTILRKPETILSGVLFFDSEPDCFAFSAHARERLAPRALEFFDSHSLRILAGRHEDIPEHAGAALLFEQECRAAEQESLLKEWTEQAEEMKARSSDCWFSHRPEDHAVFRKYRYDLPVLVNERVGQRGFRKLGTDLAVPEEKAQAMNDLYLTELPRSGIEYAIWGHLGDHHLHVNFLPKNQEELERSQALYAAFAQRAIEWGGTVSAEHGIGKVRIPYLERMVGREGLKQMARVKKALDPEGILNRGNIFPAELLG